MERTLAYLLTMLCGALPAGVLFLCLRPWRSGRMRRAGLRSLPRREWAMALFWMFCGGMAMVTLTPRWLVWSLYSYVTAGGFPVEAFFSQGSVSLVPFRSFGLDSRSLYNLAGNVVMFLPFGLFSALLWRDFGWKRALTAGLCITGFIECWQLLVGRAFDVDDLMLNTLGVLCGCWLAMALRRLWPAFTAQLLVQPLPDGHLS